MRKLSESVWMDIHKQSAGDTERREDNINLLNIDGFCEYLNSNYKGAGQKNIVVRNFGDGPTIVLYFCEDESDYIRCLYYDGKSIYTQLDVFQVMGCLPELEQKYKTHIETNQHNVENISISPKDGSEITNTFFLEVFDYILDKVDVPFETLIEKI